MRYMWGLIQYDSKEEKKQELERNKKLMDKLKNAGFIKVLKKGVENNGNIQK